MHQPHNPRDPLTGHNIRHGPDMCAEWIKSCDMVAGCPER